MNLYLQGGGLSLKSWAVYGSMGTKVNREIRDGYGIWPETLVSMETKNKDNLEVYQFLAPMLDVRWKNRQCWVSEKMLLWMLLMICQPSTTFPHLWGKKLWEPILWANDWWEPRLWDENVWLRQKICQEFPHKIGTPPNKEKGFSFSHAHLDGCSFMLAGKLEC